MANLKTTSCRDVRSKSLLGSVFFFWNAQPKHHKRQYFRPLSWSWNRLRLLFVVFFVVPDHCLTMASLCIFPRCGYPCPCHPRWALRWHWWPNYASRPTPSHCHLRRSAKGRGHTSHTWRFSKDFYPIKLGLNGIYKTNIVFFLLYHLIDEISRTDFSSPF